MCARCLLSLVSNSSHRENINSGVAQACVETYNELVNIAKNFDAEHKQLFSTSKEIARKLAASKDRLKLKQRENDALKAEVEKRVKEVARRPVVDKETMVSRMRGGISSN